MYKKIEIYCCGNLTWYSLKCSAAAKTAKDVGEFDITEERDSDIKASISAAL